MKNLLCVIAVFAASQCALWAAEPRLYAYRSFNPAFGQMASFGEYGSAGVNVAARLGGRLAYIHSYDAATPAVLRRLAESAGVKMYVDALAPVYANSRHVAVHVADGGRRKVSLPFKCARVVEAFTGRLAGEDCESFFYEFSSPDTALFEMRAK